MCVNLISQTEFQVASYRLSGKKDSVAKGGPKNGLCYLCGHRLVGHKKPQYAVRQTEHVIPESILNLIDVQHNRLPLTLPVHSVCDSNLKQMSDDGIKQYLSLFSDQEIDSNKYGLLKKIINVNEVTQVGVDRYLVPGVGPIIDAVACWIQGMHAALYVEYLSHDYAKTRIYGPQRHVDRHAKMPIDEQLVLQDRWWQISENFFAIANSQKTLNRVEAWGRQVVFEIGWLRTPKSIRYSKPFTSKHRSTRFPKNFKYIAIWRLRTPGMETLATMEKRPIWWYGTYGQEWLPNGAKITVYDK